MTKEQQVNAIIKSSKGKMVTVTFVKRTKKDEVTGRARPLKAGESPEIRVMNCRLGVKKHLKGGTLNYVPIEHGLIGVFDMQKLGYRSISLEGVTEIVENGVVHTFD